MAGPIQIIKDISAWLAPGDSEETCASYRSQLKRSHRILFGVSKDLEPHRAAIAALLDGHDPLRESAENALLKKIVGFLDARIAKMTDYLAKKAISNERQAEVRAKLAECQVMRQWVEALRSGY